MSVTVKLTHPVKYRGGTITEVVLREPTFKDMRELGVPGTAGGDERQAVEDMFKYVVRLANLEEQALNMIDAKDGLRCVQVILPFFTPSGEQPT